MEMSVRSDRSKKTLSPAPSQTSATHTARSSDASRRLQCDTKTSYTASSARATESSSSEARDPSAAVDPSSLASSIVALRPRSATPAAPASVSLRYASSDPWRTSGERGQPAGEADGPVEDVERGLRAEPLQRDQRLGNELGRDHLLPLPCLPGKGCNRAAKSNAKNEKTRTRLEKERD